MLSVLRTLSIAVLLTSTGALAQPHPPGSGSGAEAAAPCENYYSPFLGRFVQYCVSRSSGSGEARRPGEAVVYFMHGIGGNARSWNEYGFEKAAQQLAGERGREAPAVTYVSFDTAAMSFFSDRGGRATGSSAYESWFTGEFLREMERRLGVCKERSCRGLVGVSMGGLGAIKTALRHPELFSVVAANVPALPPFNPHEDRERWMAYFGRHPVGTVQGGVLLAEARAVFPTRELADANDPSVIVEKWDGARPFPALYFDYAGKDYFGFWEGALRFTDALQKRGLDFSSVYVADAGHDLYKDRGIDVLRFATDRVAPAH